MANENETPTGTDDFASGLDAERPEAFRFENPGDRIIGELVDVTSGYDRKYRNDSYPIALIRDERDGTVKSVHIFHATMLSGFAKADPRIGERVGIVYMGDREPERGENAYRDYRVKVDRARSATRFSDIADVASGEDDLPF